MYVLRHKWNDKSAATGKAIEFEIFLEALACLMLNNMGPFTNYVYKKRGVGGQKNRLFVNFYTIENVNGGG